MLEIWKDIIGYEGYYQVSNLGNVKSLARKGSGSSLKDRILKPGLSGSKYLFVHFSVNGKVKMMQVHRLVAIAFIQNKLNKKEVNHINGIKTDNRVENLEWLSPSENIKHGLSLGIMNTAKGSQKKNSKFTEEQVYNIKIRLKNGEIGFRIAKELGVHKEVIAGIRKGRTWKHVLV